MKNSSYLKLSMFIVFSLFMTISCKKDVITTKPPDEIKEGAISENNTMHQSDSSVMHAKNSILAKIEIDYLLVGNSVHDMSPYLPPEIVAGAWTVKGEAFNFRSIYFTTGIPTGVTIQSAYLSLYSNPTPINGDHVHANAGSNNAFYIRRITGAWDIFNPGSVNWFNQPATTPTNQVLIPHTTSPFLDLVNINVTNLVRDMQTSGNNGFMIQLQNESLPNCRIFGSCTFPDVTKRPKLIVNYIL